MREHERSGKRIDGHALMDMQFARTTRKNVRVIVLEEGLALDDLEAREEYWIVQHRSLVTHNGYNLATGNAFLVRNILERTPSGIILGNHNTRV